MKQTLCENKNIAIMKRLLQNEPLVFKFLVEKHILLLSSPDAKKYIRYLVKHYWTYIADYIERYNFIYQYIKDAHLTSNVKSNTNLFNYLKWLYKYTLDATQPADFLYIIHLTIRKKNLVNIITEFIDVFGDKTKCNNVLSVFTKRQERFADPIY